MKETVRSTGATSTSKISKDVKTDILQRAKATATKAGLTLTVNTSAKTFTLVKSNGDVLASGNYTKLATNPGTVGGGAGSNGAASNGAKLLYTGANYALYALPVLAIVAVAIVVKKRA